MNDHDPTKPAPAATAPVPRKPYRPPRLQSFGKLHLRTQGSNGLGADGGGLMTMMSDRRAKEDIVRVGTHPLGIGLYLFRYKRAFSDAGGSERRLGVMADEVERVLPAAVSVDPDGYRRVDYALLGFDRAAR
jgi:hypothetical protein